MDGNIILNINTILMQYVLESVAFFVLQFIS